jgi:two-component system response regulator FlrC
MNRRILLVDDDPGYLWIAQKAVALRMPGCRVLAVASGQAALTALDREPFDVVVTDYNMPDMDGLALLRTLRQVYPETHVIMVTGSPNEDVRAEARRLNVRHYLVKPVEVEALCRLLASPSGGIVEKSCCSY